MHGQGHSLGAHPSGPHRQGPGPFPGRTLRPWLPLADFPALRWSAVGPRQQDGSSWVALPVGRGRFQARGPALDRGHSPDRTAHLAEDVQTPSQRVTVTLAVHPWYVTSSSSSLRPQASGGERQVVGRQPQGMSRGRLQALWALPDPREGGMGTPGSDSPLCKVGATATRELAAHAGLGGTGSRGGSPLALSLGPAPGRLPLFKPHWSQTSQLCQNKAAVPSAHPQGRGFLRA